MVIQVFQYLVWTALLTHRCFGATPELEVGSEIEDLLGGYMMSGLCEMNAVDMWRRLLRREFSFCSSAAHALTPSLTLKKAQAQQFPASPFTFTFTFTERKQTQEAASSSSTVQELLRLIDLSCQVWTSSTVRMVQQHHFSMSLSQFLFRHC